MPRTSPQAKTAAKKTPSKTKAPTPKKSSGPGANPLADPVLKRRYDETLDRYRSSRAQEMTGWDERYEALGEILDESLYLAGGFRSESAFLVAEAPDVDPRSIRTYIRVAKFFEPEDEAKFGIARLDLLLGYLEAAGGSTLASAKLRPEKTMVQVTRGKTQRRMPFADVTAAELKLAARKARGEAAGTKAETIRSTPWVKAIRGALREAKVNGVAVSERGERLTLSDIPRDQLGALGRALVKVKAPA